MIVKNLDSAHPLKRNNADYLRIKYIETEKQRQDLVSKLREIRNEIINNYQTIPRSNKSFSEVCAVTSKSGTFVWDLLLFLFSQNIA